MTERTSQTHPLHIADVRAAAGSGRIGITLCPGKQQSDALTGGWARDLEADLDAIAAWGAAAVVTLAEDMELAALGVPGLGAAVAQRHMLWRHLPIPDATAPDAPFEREWVTSGEGLRALLRAGFDIVVHSKGGLGRTGTVAARLLAELGVAAPRAIDMVRAVRQGAIVTPAQFDHVLTRRPMSEAMPDRNGNRVRDRAIGALVGLAVGDAIGTTLEFTTRDSRPMLTDMIGGGPFGLAAGQWTDDTAMALALADSLMADPGLDPADLMQRFVEWHEGGRYSCTGRCFDIGITTRAALDRWRATGEPLAGSLAPDTAGNGSLMRLAPVAIRHWRDPIRRQTVAARQSHTTHGAPEAVAACTVFAEMLADAIAGRPRSAVLAPRPSAWPGTMGPVLAGGWRGQPRTAIRSSGYVAHSLEAALWCVARTTDFAEAVLLAANLGDDADTVAAITGQLAGALYGVSAIPPVWRARLAWGKRIERMAGALFDAAG